MVGTRFNVALLHAAGYVGGELIRLLLNHPLVDLCCVTSRTFAGKPLWIAHPHLRGETDLTFSSHEDIDVEDVDAVLIAAEHGKGAEQVLRLLDAGFDGIIVDLSADFRFQDASVYDRWFGFVHPSPELLSTFAYGLPEINAPYQRHVRRVANPGCFATGIALSLSPPARHLNGLDVAVTAMTGASGSGAKPRPTTHFPTREGNVRAYKVLSHQHLPEVQQILGDDTRVSFIPVSGPWTRGIWGTAQIALSGEIDADDVSAWFAAAYADKPFVRLWPGELPELRYAVNTPFCDIGWIVAEGRLIVAFAMDNLLKGAASQAVQNLNLLLDLPETTGLIRRKDNPITETA